MWRSLGLTSEEPAPGAAVIADVHRAAVRTRRHIRRTGRWAVRNGQEEARTRIAAPAVLPIRTHRQQVGPQRLDAFVRHRWSDAALFNQREEADPPLFAGCLGGRFPEVASARATAPRRRLERLDLRPRPGIVRVERLHAP